MYLEEVEYSVLRDTLQPSNSSPLHTCKEFCIMELMLSSKVIIPIYISTCNIEEIWWVHSFANSYYC